MYLRTFINATMYPTYHNNKEGRGWGQGGEMNQALYPHMNNKRKMKKKKNEQIIDFH
jgi:hypothetical protein